jgi:hypothetical protein
MYSGKDDPRLLLCPDTIPNVRRAWAMKVWMDFHREHSDTFVKRQAWWIESMTTELWPVMELEEL